MLSLILFTLISQSPCEKAFNLFEPQVPLYSKLIVDEAIWTGKEVVVGKNINVDKLPQNSDKIVCVSNHKDFANGVNELVVINGKLCFKPQPKPLEQTTVRTVCGPNGCYSVPINSMSFSSCQSCGR